MCLCSTVLADINQSLIVWGENVGAVKVTTEDVDEDDRTEIREQVFYLF